MINCIIHARNDHRDQCRYAITVPEMGSPCNHPNRCLALRSSDGSALRV